MKALRTIVCETCGEEYNHWHYASKYCSDNCKHKSMYARTRKKVLGKEYQLQKRYGLSLIQYNEMSESQGGNCAICFQKPKLLYVDHCHESGSVRALLCSKCNMAMGLLQDKKENALSMYTYLKNYEPLKAVKER